MCLGSVQETREVKIRPRASFRSRRIITTGHWLLAVCILDIGLRTFEFFFLMNTKKTRYQRSGLPPKINAQRNGNDDQGELSSQMHFFFYFKLSLPKKKVLLIAPVLSSICCAVRLVR